MDRIEKLTAALASAKHDEEHFRKRYHKGGIYPACFRDARAIRIGIEQVLDSALLEALAA